MYNKASQTSSMGSHVELLKLIARAFSKSVKAYLMLWGGTGNIFDEIPVFPF